MDQLTSEGAKKAMRAVAEDYEKIAEITEAAEAKRAEIEKKDVKGS